MPLPGFFVTIALILLAFDGYSLMNWRRFVRQRGWSPWWYRSMFIVMGIMLVLFPLSIVLRRTTPQQTPTTMFLAVLTAFWYLPKLPIVLVLLVRDIIRLFTWIGKKIVGLFTRSSAAKAASATAPVSAPAAKTTVEDRRKFLQTTGWALAGVPFIMVGKGLVHTVYNFQVYRQDIYLPGLSRAFDGMTIAQISDIHTGSFSSTAPIQEIFRITQGLKPDMILLTGDFVNSDPREMSFLIPSLNKVRAPLGVYGSLGNHDHYMDEREHRDLVKALRDTSINLFVNQNTIFSVDGGKLQLAGTDNSGMNQNYADLDAALAGFSPEHPTILMAHDPTFWDKKVRFDTHVDLMLSGHTHGGQFGVHLLGQEISVAEIVYKQWAGLYREGDKQLYVNRGVGTTAFPVRVGIDPEITLLTLRKA
jgi:predicted MPP superfamily phosphohydrolase